MQQAYLEVKDRIVTLELRPGQRLDDIGLGVQLGLSRTPVREALHRLMSEGLVTISPGNGMAVRALDLLDVGQLFEAHVVVARAIARLCAVRATKDDMVCLRNATQPAHPERSTPPGSGTRRHRRRPAAMPATLKQKTTKKEPTQHPSQSHPANHEKSRLAGSGGVRAQLLSGITVDRWPYGERVGMPLRIGVMWVSEAHLTGAGGAGTTRFGRRWLSTRRGRFDRFRGLP